MEITCACGNPFFTKQMKLKKLMGQDEIIEEMYYTCTKCGFTIARKEVKTFPIIKASGQNKIILHRDHD